MKTGDIVIYKGMLGRVVKSNQLYKFHPVNYGRCYFDTLDTITEDMVREASHHEKVRLISEEFTCGRILDIHCVNNYQINMKTRKQRKFYGMDILIIMILIYLISPWILL